ncbi:hypothetical protein L7F22_054605 [Adiantum nelumboides]|nr:hypothetical protein [Adiantum nelumboides]
MANADEVELEEGEIPRAPKHRLERAWTLCIYNNVIQPSQLAPGADFHCFKAGIEPKWEDPICAHGGKWSITSQRGKSMIDTLWLYTVLATIGEQFSESDEICGVVVSIRARLEKLALWTKIASNEGAQYVATSA